MEMDCKIVCIIVIIMKKKRYKVTEPFFTIILGYLISNTVNVIGFFDVKSFGFTEGFTVKS